MDLIMFIIAVIGLAFFCAGLVVDYWIHREEDGFVSNILAKFTAQQEYEPRHHKRGYPRGLIFLLGLSMLAQV